MAIKSHSLTNPRSQHGILLTLAVLLAVPAACLCTRTGIAAKAADQPVATEQLKLSVAYVTNRQGIGGERMPKGYGGDRGTPSFGRCEVVFAPIPLINELAPRVPFYVPAETRTLRLTRQVEVDDFWDRLVAEVEITSSRSVVVFVHGYNYGFERNCKAAADLQRSLRGKAVVLMFSWPSNGQPADYVIDQADVEWSVPLLAEILRQLGDRIDRRRMQVLAHSLGTRGVIMALDYLSAERDQRPVIGPLVLVAPDFDADTFVERLPRLVSLTNGITVYASSNDTPLKASQKLHGSRRLGEAGEFLTVAEGMQTVDVSPLGRYQILGHEYFLFHPRVSTDLAILLGTGRGAHERPGLRAVRHKGLVHWQLTKDAAPSDADN